MNLKSRTFTGNSMIYEIKKTAFHASAKHMKTGMQTLILTHILLKLQTFVKLQHSASAPLSQELSTSIHPALNNSHLPQTSSLCLFFPSLHPLFPSFSISRQCHRRRNYTFHSLTGVLLFRWVLSGLHACMCHWLSLSQLYMQYSFTYYCKR